MNKNRKGKKSYREMAEEAGVSVGHIAKAVKVDELGRSEEVIRGEKTVNEILREEGLLPPLKEKRAGAENSATEKSKLETCIETLKALTDAELETLADALVKVMTDRGLL